MAFAVGDASLEHGMRQGELLKLKWEDVDLERGSITIIQSKTLRRKTIAINEPARQALNWLQANRYGELLFMRPWGAPIGKVTVYDAFKRACGAVKIDDFRFHDLCIPSRLIWSWRAWIWSLSEGIAWP